VGRCLAGELLALIEGKVSSIQKAIQPFLVERESHGQAVDSPVCGERVVRVGENEDLVGLCAHRRESGLILPI
jgi:hypothetical protein